MIRYLLQISVVLLVLCGTDVLAGTNTVARPLVTRLLDARNGSVSPKKPMWRARETGKSQVDWPFDVARVERLFEKQLVRAADGSFVLKREVADPKPDSVKSENALKFVNRVIAEWSVMELDKKFTRLTAEVIRRLAAYREDLDPLFWMKFAIITQKGVEGGGTSMRGGWVTGWLIAPKVYLLLTSDLKSCGNPREYQFVMWDGKLGKDWPIAGFDQLPDAARVRTVLGALDSAAAANNLAVLLHAREANRTTYMEAYVETLLRRAAQQGCDEAYHNLGVLAEERGDAEQAAAFYSREKK